MSSILNIKKTSILGRRQCFNFDGARTRLIRIGRMQAAHIPIDDRRVSRLQGIIRYRDNLAELQNVGHPQGLLLNGKRPQKNRWLQLRRGDRIELGNETLCIQFFEPGYTDVKAELPQELSSIGENTRLELVGWLQNRRKPAPPNALTPSTPQSVELEALVRIAPEADDGDKKRPSYVVQAEMSGLWRAGKCRPAKTPAREFYDTAHLLGEFKQEQRQSKALVLAVAFLSLAFFAATLNLSSPNQKPSVSLIQK